MSKKRQSFGAKPKRLAELLSMGVEPDPQKLLPREGKAELLGAQLAAPLACESDSGQAAVFSAKSLGEILLDDCADLEVLKQAKRYGRALSAQKEPASQHAAGIAIYFAAIAGAMLFHNEKITAYDYPELVTAFDSLAAKKWIPAELCSHFQAACGLSRGRAQDPGPG